MIGWVHSQLYFASQYAVSIEEKTLFYSLETSTMFSKLATIVLDIYFSADNRYWAKPKHTKQLNSFLSIVLVKCSVVFVSFRGEWPAVEELEAQLAALVHKAVG